MQVSVFTEQGKLDIQLSDETYLQTTAERWQQAQRYDGILLKDFWEYIGRSGRSYYTFQKINITQPITEAKKKHKKH